MVAPPLAEDLSRSIARCADALGDLPRLKLELAQLRATGDGIAHFATALFELELARQGDAESRANLTHLADMLLLFWRDGSGDSLARVHPALDSLWHSVAPMLVQFELKRFELDLAMCWKVRSQPHELIAAVENLEPQGHKRVEFARCLYHLELARQGVEASRSQFARRAGLLADAYQDVGYANDLIGHDAGLLHLWSELKPYLDEFFETLEENASRAQESTKRVKMPVAPPPLPTAPRAPPPAPANLTPPGSWVPDADVIIEDAVIEAPPPPPRPSGEIEVVDIEEDLPPPLPPVTPAHGLAAILEGEEIEFDPEPDPATIKFWDYTFASLQLAPADGLRTRMLATEGRNDRKRLTTWLDGLGSHLAVPEAKTFASLVRLMLAGETKEKSLFGQANPRRKEALQSAFSLLTADAEAAGRAAVWFELDGEQTKDALHRGLELLMPYLAFCAREALDPLSPAAVERYLT